MGCAFSLHFTGTVCWIAACLTAHMCLMASAIWVFSIQLHMAAFQKFGKYFASCYLKILSVRKHAFINNSFLSRPENFTKFMWLLVSVSVQILGLRAGWAGRGLKVHPVPTPSLNRDTSHRPGAQSHWEDGHTQLWDAVPRPHHPLMDSFRTHPNWRSCSGACLFAELYIANLTTFRNLGTGNCLQLCFLLVTPLKLDCVAVRVVCSAELSYLCLLYNIPRQ